MEGVCVRGQVTFITAATTQFVFFRSKLGEDRLYMYTGMRDRVGDN